MTVQQTPDAPPPVTSPDEGEDRGSIVEVTQLTKVFGGLVANRDIDFTIPRRSIVSIIGPNGAGKTTLFNQISGYYQPTSGAIVFDGVNIVGLAPNDVAELGIGRTYQNIRLFSDMTVLANVMVGRHARLKTQWYEVDPRACRASSARRRRRGSGRASCSISSACHGATSRTSPRTCPTASSAASRWRGRSPATRSSCCSTSRRPA